VPEGLIFRANWNSFGERAQIVYTVKSAQDLGFFPSRALRNYRMQSAGTEHPRYQINSEGLQGV